MPTSRTPSSTRSDPTFCSAITSRAAKTGMSGETDRTWCPFVRKSCATVFMSWPRCSQERLHLADELGEAVLGVAEEHHALLVVVQVVVDAGEARAHAAFEHDDGLGAVHLEDRHAVEGARLVVPGGGAGDVVGALHQHDCGLREKRGDRVHPVELLVRAIGPGPEDAPGAR